MQILHHSQLPNSPRFARAAGVGLDECEARTAQQPQGPERKQLLPIGIGYWTWIFAHFHIPQRPWGQTPPLTPNTIVMKIVPDSNVIGPLSAHVKDLSLAWLQNKKRLVINEDGELLNRYANNSAERKPSTGDIAERNSPMDDDIISYSGSESQGESAKIPHSPPSIGHWYWYWTFPHFHIKAKSEGSHQ